MPMAVHLQRPSPAPLGVCAMFTDYRPSHGYDEYFSAADQPRAA